MPELTRENVHETISYFVCCQLCYTDIESESESMALQYAKDDGFELTDGGRVMCADCLRQIGVEDKDND